jgi:hypothetical protein
MSMPTESQLARPSRRDDVVTVHLVGGRPVRHSALYGSEGKRAPLSVRSLGLEQTTRAN